jgi:hypothetical protein
VPYPFTLDLTADNAAVQDIEILNPFNAVRAVLAGDCHTSLQYYYFLNLIFTCSPSLHRPHPGAAAQHRAVC